MARMHCRSKGVSESTIPYNKEIPHWVEKTKEEVVDIICSLARKGIKPSHIGKIMRDEYAIGHVKSMTGMHILTILQKNGLDAEIPEDLASLIEKCLSIKNHLNIFKNDKNAKYRLNLIESRMYRLARYYKRKSVIKADWSPYTITK